ncbi:MAG: glutamate-5-semialdehyde dehydrogenase [Cyclobacteriaceae bacterium]|nr:glutamate-5-semialdehyde dehydrogenase [Cyclobacteriaceae bacterium]
MNVLLNYFYAIMVLDERIKNKVLVDLAELIHSNKDEIIRRNLQDIENARNLDDTLLDRLKVDNKKVEGMIRAVNEVIALADPQGELLHSYAHPNGMLVENRSVPFGTIMIIYESRPDVTIEAAISAFKAGNKILLKGGKESLHSNQYLVELWHEALKLNHIPIDYVTYLNINREETQKLLKENTYNIDLIIPRGGEGLINYVKQNTSIPVIVSGRGNNFVYIHEDANFEMAMNIAINGKSRLSVCNATDKILFHKDLPNLEQNILELFNRFSQINIEVIADENFPVKVSEMNIVSGEAMYFEEFLAPKIMFSLVDSMDTAIAMINKYSGGHSATIVTETEPIAEEFMNETDCAAVYHNASTRFTDGGQFGFGAEMAISTQKIHFRGPVGLAQLVTNKWYIKGKGEIRK